MIIADVISFLESVAPPPLQERYDNAGLITGEKNWDCTGILCALDSTPDVIHEAIENHCNLIVAHHPIIFSGLKKINGENYVEKAVITAIKNNIAIYAIHTNLDNVLEGVNGKMAEKMGLRNISILSPKDNTLKKLFTFVPVKQSEEVRNAIFSAGGGNIGNYSECSFNSEGTGTYRAAEGANPFAGEVGKRHREAEIRIEVIFPSWLEHKIVAAMKAVHPYEEVAFDIVDVVNKYERIGSGALGELEIAVTGADFLALLKKTFRLAVIRHTALLNKGVKKIAVCGGAGFFLLQAALAAGADAFVTADIKYHEFFDANARLMIVDIGHYESEHFTIELLAGILAQKYPNFAVLKTRVDTNPVKYFI